MKRMSKSKSDISSLIEELNTSSDTSAEKTIAKILVLGPGAVPALLRAAKNEKAPRIRKWSLQALGAMGDKRVTAVLVEALKDDRMTVRLHALRGLGRLKMKKAATAIVKLLEDSSGGIRVNALYSLIEIGEPKVAPMIQKLLSDPQWYVRQTACVACGKFKVIRSKKVLMHLATHDSRKAVREAADQALHSMRRP